MKRVLPVFCALTITCTGLSLAPVLAENAPIANMEILVEKVKADKKLLVAGNMGLTDQESKEFWPLYDSYQRDLASINRHLMQLINQYADAYNKGPVPDDIARELITESLKTEEAEVHLRKECAKKLSAFLPPQKVARYLQIENKIRAAIKYDLAANIPLMD